MITATTIVFELFIGKLSDKISKKKVLKYGSLFYSFGWILKIFVSSVFHIFIVDVYHKITKSITKAPFEAITYDIAVDNGHYIDEFTVIKEMALHIGRSSAYIILIFISFYTNIQWTFLLAAFASIAIISIKQTSLN